MEDIITMLGKFPMFEGLTEQQLEKINTQMIVKNYCAGQIVLHEGDKGESMYVLLKGKVEVKKSLRLLPGTANTITLIVTSKSVKG